MIYSRDPPSASIGLIRLPRRAAGGGALGERERARRLADAHSRDSSRGSAATRRGTVASKLFGLKRGRQAGRRPVDGRRVM